PYGRDSIALCFKDLALMQDAVDSLIDELSTLRSDMIGLERRYLHVSGDPHSVHIQSARNLLHYLAFRRRDLRGVQEKLAELGLSSLGRAESHVLTTVETVLRTLHRSSDRQSEMAAENISGIDFAEGKQLLEQHTEMLLGPPQSGRSVRIMV